MERFFRQHLHLNQEELADLLGISKSAVGMYETGLRPLTEAADARLQLLKEYWQRFVREGLPPGALLHAAPPDLKRCKMLVEACVRKASADAVRYSQLLEQMNNNQRQLEQKQFFIRYLMLQETGDSFPLVVLRKLEQQLKKRSKSCCADLQQVLVFRLNTATVLQQLALDMRRTLG